MALLLRVALRPRLVRSATVLTVAALCFAGPSGAQAASSCRSASLAEASSAGSCWMPFSSGSAFHTQLGRYAPLAPDNAAVQQHIARYGWTVGPSATGFSIGSGSRPVFYAGASDPVMTIHCTAAYGPNSCQGANGVDVNGTQIHVPAGARPDGDTDAHMTVIETATGAEYDFWHASVSGSTITSATGAETNVNTGDGAGGGGDAANLALSAGLLRPAELMSGQIDHALVAVVPCTSATGADVGYTWPAEGGWGQFCGQFWHEDASGAPGLGQLMRLNMTAAEISDSGAPAWEQAIMTALADYGAYIEDTEGSWHNEGIYILEQGSASWTDVGQPDQWAAAAHAFGQTGDSLSSDVPIPASRLEMVSTCVTQGVCPNNGNPVAQAASAHLRRHTHSRDLPHEARRGRRHAHRHHRRERRWIGTLSRWRIAVARHA